MKYMMLFLMLSIGLTACGEKEEEKTESSVLSETAKKAEKKVQGAADKANKALEEQKKGLDKL